MYTLQGKTWPTRHVRFPHQSTYARRTLPAGGPRTWQPSTSHRQGWTESLLPRKGAPDTIPSAPADRSTGPYPVSLPSQPMKQWRKSNTHQQQATWFTGPISPACDRYIQYLLMGANRTILNWHRWGLQPWRCRLNTYCYRQKLTWSIWAKKRAAIKMGFEDNHDWVVNRPLRGYFWAGLGHVSL
jgi:hypothetical protein